MAKKEGGNLEIAQNNLDVEAYFQRYVQYNARDFIEVGFFFPNNFNQARRKASADTKRTKQKKGKKESSF